MKKLVSIVMPCFNEEDNVRDAVETVEQVMAKLPSYDYEHVFIDNASTDKTVSVLRELCATNPRLRVIVNARNFGQVRSPYYAMMQVAGDAIVVLPSDMQEHPDLVPDLIAEWEKGAKSVLAVKKTTRETLTLWAIRKIYYAVINRLSDVPLVKNATGYGLFDRSVVETMRQIGDRYPYFRGLVCDIGTPLATVPYDQRPRKRGITSHNFLTLYDVAMLGITSHSKAPLRLATMMGFLLSFISLLTALGYLVAKLVFWPQFPMGTAPMLIGLFTLASVQLFFVGLLGEYVGAIHTQMLNRPLVVERERINFATRAREAVRHEEHA